MGLSKSFDMPWSEHQRLQLRFEVLPYEHAAHGNVRFQPQRVWSATRSGPYHVNLGYPDELVELYRHPGTTARDAGRSTFHVLSFTCGSLNMTGWSSRASARFATGGSDVSDCSRS